MGPKRVTLVQKRATLGIFSTHWIFQERQGFFVASVAYRVQEESEPVLWSYFLWHFIVGDEDLNVSSEKSQIYAHGAARESAQNRHQRSMTRNH